MALLRPLLLDNVPSIQQSAALALGRLANYSDELAEAVVSNEILPQLVYSLSEQNVSYNFYSNFSVSTKKPQLTFLDPSLSTHPTWPRLLSTQALLTPSSTASKSSIPPSRRLPPLPFPASPSTTTSLPSQSLMLVQSACLFCAFKSLNSL